MYTGKSVKTICVWQSLYFNGRKLLMDLDINVIAIKHLEIYLWLLFWFIEELFSREMVSIRLKRLILEIHQIYVILRNINFFKNTIFLCRHICRLWNRLERFLGEPRTLKNPYSSFMTQRGEQASRDGSR